ncbi:hypothetical protein [Spiroplasma endosymbiont of Panorpa germanica]|uniref:hypothetical protein n=1 Tax=Spiroplasma endosymbiont of Panorpa germanica TaxID=3066314 RepID=UPI0030D1BA19
MSIIFTIRFSISRNSILILTFILSIICSFGFNIKNNNTINTELNFNLSSSTNISLQTNDKKIGLALKFQKSQIYKDYFYRSNWNPNEDFVELEKESLFLNNFCKSKKSQILFNDYHPHFYCYHEKEEVINSFNQTKLSNLNIIADDFFVNNYDNPLVLPIIKKMSDDSFSINYFNQLREVFGENYYLNEDNLTVDLFKSIRITKNGIIFEDYNPTKQDKEQLVLFYKYLFYNSLIDYFNQPLKDSVVDVSNYKLVDSFFNNKDKYDYGSKKLWNEFLITEGKNDSKDLFNVKLNQSEILEEVLTPAVLLQVIGKSSIENNFAEEVRSKNSRIELNKYFNVFQFTNVIFKNIGWSTSNQLKIMPIINVETNAMILGNFPYFPVKFLSKNNQNFVNNTNRNENILFYMYLFTFFLILFFVSWNLNLRFLKKLYGSNQTEYLFNEINWKKFFKKR